MYIYEILPYICREEDARRRRACLRVFDGRDTQGRVERSAQAGCLLLPTAAYNYSLLTPCLLRAYSLLTPCLLRAHYVFATRLLLTCLTHAVCAGFDTLSDLILSYLIYRRLRSHVQIRSVLRDSVDPYALENVDF